MKRRIAIIGLGRVGKACAEAIAASDDLAAGGIVRRPKNLGLPLPQTLHDVPMAPHASKLSTFDLALNCLPTPLVLEVATNLLQHRIPIVAAATVSGTRYPSYRRQIDEVAVRHKVAAVGPAWLSSIDKVADRSGSLPSIALTKSTRPPTTC